MSGYVGEWTPIEPGQRETERPWQITPDDKVIVGEPGELHMEMEERHNFPYGYAPYAEGVIKGNTIHVYQGSQNVTPEHEHEIKRQAQEHLADYQPLNDASPYDFSKPRFDTTQGEHPWLVHQTDEGLPEVIAGGLGDLHTHLRDAHDVGHELLRGYYNPTLGEHKVEVGDEQYLPLVEKHFEAMEEDPYPTERDAATIQDGKWAYLNGDVGFGQFHHQILDTLGEKQNLPKMQKGLISNLALSNAHPANVGHDVAWGAFHQGYPVFWRTNVDRNHIWDAVQNARKIVEPPSPVTAGLKEFSELDIIKESTTASGGQTVEVQPGGQHYNYDGQLVSLPEPTTTNTPQLTRSQNYYGANVVKDGEIIGSVSVEVEGNTRRNGEHWQEVVIHDAYVKPENRGSDVWLLLYQWLRQHWPNDRFFGEFANQQMGEFFEKDNRRHYIGDDNAWDATGIGDETQPVDQDQPNYPPGHYAAVTVADGSTRVHPIPGLGYFADAEDITGQTRAGGRLQIDPDTSEPMLYVQHEEAEPPGRGHGTMTRIGPFEKGDWRYGQEELPHHKIISVEHGPHHYYTLKAEIHGPIKLHKSDDSGLRPMTYGNLEFGEPKTTIRLRGREHPLYDSIDVHPNRATEHYGAMEARAPWYIGEDGVPVVGDWHQFHSQIGGRGRQPVKGDVNESGQVRVFSEFGHPHPDPQGVVDQVAPHLRRAFGFGMHPTLWEGPQRTDALDWSEPEAPTTPPEAPESDPNGLRARMKGLASRFRTNRLGGDTGYSLVGAAPGEVGYHNESTTGMPHMLENGEWASWSGWPDAYRFISDGHDYMEQPEAALKSGHGFGHNGMRQVWDAQRMDTSKSIIRPPSAPRAGLSGWHIPMRDGTRGIVVYREPGSVDTSAIQAHIEAHHGPARVLDWTKMEHLDPQRAMMQHPYGKLIMGQMPAPEPGIMNFDNPAPAPGAIHEV